MVKATVKVYRPPDSVLAWPSDPAGPWRLSITWALVAGRVAPVGLSLRPIDDASPQPLSAADLRSLRWAEVVAECLRARADELNALIEHVMEARQLGEEWAFEAASMERSAKAEIAQTKGGPLRDKGGRPSLTDAELREVARIYTLAAGISNAPTGAVAEHFKLSKSAAANRVSKCRKRGLLPPTTAGKPRGGIA